MIRSASDFMDDDEQEATFEKMGNRDDRVLNVSSGTRFRHTRTAKNAKRRAKTNGIQRRRKKQIQW